MGSLIMRQEQTSQVNIWNLRGMTQVSTSENYANE